MTEPADLRAAHFLDPGVVFLNHGSYGATPRPVLAAYQRWQRRIERQPVAFFARELLPLLAEARRALAGAVNADPDDIVFVPNATYATNVVARSLVLNAGDEILLTNHAYGACANAWEYVARARGAVVRRQHVDFGPPETQVEQLWAGVMPRTRVLFLSHITSPTAVTLPVAALCARARTAGLLSVVDGAHAVGQIPLDLGAIGADFYFSNAHKWLGAPKGAAFLHARPERQALIAPLVVGWAWNDTGDQRTGKPFLDQMQWPGTHDPSAYLSVPAALAFQAAHDWSAVRARCHALLSETLEALAAITGRPVVYPSADAYAQMAVAELPALRSPSAFQARLWTADQIEIPCTTWNGRHFLRLSVQGYNSADDLARLVTAVHAHLPAHRRDPDVA